MSYYDQGHSLDHRLCLSRIHRLEVELGIIPPDPPPDQWVWNGREWIECPVFGYPPQPMPTTIIDLNALGYR